QPQRALLDGGKHREPLVVSGSGAGAGQPASLGGRGPRRSAHACHPRRTARGRLRPRARSGPLAGLVGGGLVGRAVEEMSVHHPTMSIVPSLDEIVWLRDNSPAWRLLRADNAPLVLSFLHQVFVADNLRSISATDLVSRLDDELYAINQRESDRGGRRFPK